MFPLLASASASTADEAAAESEIPRVWFAIEQFFDNRMIGFWHSSRVGVTFDTANEHTLASNRVLGVNVIGEP